jgi:hypothetical protein
LQAASSPRLLVKAAVTAARGLDQDLACRRRGIGPRCNELAVIREHIEKSLRDGPKAAVNEDAIERPGIARHRQAIAENDGGICQSKSCLLYTI